MCVCACAPVHVLVLSNNCVCVCVYMFFVCVSTSIIYYTIYHLVYTCIILSTLLHRISTSETVKLLIICYCILSQLAIQCYSSFKCDLENCSPGYTVHACMHIMSRSAHNTCVSTLESGNCTSRGDWDGCHLSMITKRFACIPFHTL